MKKHVLIAGESWVTYSVHIKGADAFTSCIYEEGVGWLRSSLKSAGYLVTHLPNHLAQMSFPFKSDDISKYDAIILSDIGTNTLLLPKETFIDSQITPNRLQLIRDYVYEGGSLVMIGGYMTFQGIEGKARYYKTPVEEILPVKLKAVDDRVECPQGIKPKVIKNDHPVVMGLPETWPDVLGYNQVVPKEGADILVVCGDDPLVVVWSIGKGKSMAFTTDCGPHWAPPQFVNWSGYNQFWQQATDWLCSGR